MTIDLLFEKAGQAVAMLYFGYGILLLAGAVFSLHALVFLLLVLATRRDVPRFPRLVLLAELLYGFANPLVYLVILQRTVVPGYAFLTGVAWGLLLLVWGCRLWGGFDRVRGSAVTRRCVRGLLLLALLCIVAFLAKDVLESAIRQGSVGFQWPPQRWLDTLWGLAALASVSGLYAIPGVLVAASPHDAHGRALGQRQVVFPLLQARRPGYWIATSRGLRRLLVSAVARDCGADRAQAPRGDHQRVRAAPDRSSADCLDPVRHAARSVHAVRPAARAWGDGRLAFGPNEQHLSRRAPRRVYRAHPDQATHGARRAGHLLGGVAAGTHGGQSGSIRSGLGSGVRFQPFRYRGVPRLGGRWRLPRETIRALDPVHRDLIPKARIVEELFDDRLNIEMCALILSLYAIQWEAADPTWSLRQRPEILATLYQLGFEKSWPKANPRPNPFGERVRQVYEGPWMREHFGPA